MNEALIDNAEDTRIENARSYSLLKLILAIIFAFLSLSLCFGVSWGIDYVLRSKERGALVVLASPELSPEKAQEYIERIQLRHR